MLKTIREVDLKGKRVLVRCDFNVPLDKEQSIEDDFRIRQAIPTIEYLVKKRAKVILMSHLGSPKGKVVEGLRLTPVQEKLTEILDLSIIKASDCIGKDIEAETHKLQEGEILLLENLRFHKGEEENDPNFAKNLSKLGDIYVDDAFAVCHRNHASIVGLPKYLPARAGFLLEKEVKVLSSILEKPRRPLVAVIGGVKIESKIKAIRQLLEVADHLLIGGKIANIILVIKGICLGRPLPSKEVVEEVEKLNLTSTKLHLPIDAIISQDDGENSLREAVLGKVKKDDKIFDIGPETINIFSRIIKEAKMIVWVGPLGFFEKPSFEKGTKKVAESIAKNKEAYKIVGGGDTLFAISKFGLRNKFDYVSTGGGAMLSFLGGEELPGLEVLK